MASPHALDGGPIQHEDNWGPSDEQAMTPRGNTEPSNGAPLSAGDHRAGQDPENTDYTRGSTADAASVSGSKADTAYREKQVKPNKVYVGGLPEHTRQEDLQSCFGKIGSIVNIELKVGYGFVEFDSREAAEESVAKYHEGYFMGNKIRVELSHGGGRTAKYSGDPGACFKCGQMGHWARECPNHPSLGGGSSRRPYHPVDPPLIDRIQSSRDYLPPAQRDYRDDFGRYPPPRDARYSYEYPPLPPGREFKKPLSPPRDYRDYSGPPMRSAREYDDYRMRGPPPPSHRYDSRPGHYPPDGDGPPGYPRGYGPPPPPPRDLYDRHDRRLSPSDRYAPPYPPPSSTRPRTPPGGPVPRGRDEFDRPPTRDYPQPLEYRGRPASPPARYVSDYPPRSSTPDPPAQRYRRRSASPPPPPYESPSYLGSSSGRGFTGYSGTSGPSVSGPPPRSSGRDYTPRNSRDVGESGTYNNRRP